MICFDSVTFLPLGAISDRKWPTTAHFHWEAPSFQKKKKKSWDVYSTTEIFNHLIWNINFSQTRELAFQMHCYCFSSWEKELDLQPN